MQIFPPYGRQKLPARSSGSCNHSHLAGRAPETSASSGLHRLSPGRSRRLRNCFLHKPSAVWGPGHQLLCKEPPGGTIPSFCPGARALPSPRGCEDCAFFAADMTSVCSFTIVPKSNCPGHVGTQETQFWKEGCTGSVPAVRLSSALKYLHIKLPRTVKLSKEEDQNAVIF